MNGRPAQGPPVNISSISSRSCAGATGSDLSSSRSAAAYSGAGAAVRAIAGEAMPAGGGPAPRGSPISRRLLGRRAVDLAEGREHPLGDAARVEAAVLHLVVVAADLRLAPGDAERGAQLCDDLGAGQAGLLSNRGRIVGQGRPSPAASARAPRRRARRPSPCRPRDPNRDRASGPGSRRSGPPARAGRPRRRARGRRAGRPRRRRGARRCTRREAF